MVLDNSFALYFDFGKYCCLFKCLRGHQHPSYHFHLPSPSFANLQNHSAIVKDNVSYYCLCCRHRNYFNTANNYGHSCLYFKYLDGTYIRWVHSFTYLLSAIWSYYQSLTSSSIIFQPKATIVSPDGSHSMNNFAIANFIFLPFFEICDLSEVRRNIFVDLDLTKIALVLSWIVKSYSSD